MIDWFSKYPALGVEIGAVYVLAIAFVARVVSRRFGVPTIVPLFAGGFLAGPSGLGLLHVMSTEPAVRALMSLAVVVVLFEVTLRVDFSDIPWRTIVLLAVIGTALTLITVPIAARFYHLSRLVALMVAAICVVTGPTVIGPFMARLRPPAALAHLLETEGLVLDALGVIIAAVAFASFTTRPTGFGDAAFYASWRVALGLILGALFGITGRYCTRFLVQASSDVGKIFILFLAFATYAVTEIASHESGLVAVVACGLIMDYRALPYERHLRAFKEDLSMLALSVVFVLLASQVDVAQALPLIAPAAAISGTLIAIRVVTVFLGTLGAGLAWRERLLMATVFPRGIVAVSLGTYYATQFSAWGIRGGNVLAATIAVVVILTILTSWIASTLVWRGKEALGVSKT